MYDFLQELQHILHFLQSNKNKEKNDIRYMDTSVLLWHREPEKNSKTQDLNLTSVRFQQRPYVATNDMFV